jgi:tetratricopeptide (TPR) repeat protein
MLLKRTSALLLGVLVGTTIVTSPLGLGGSGAAFGQTSASSPPGSASPADAKRARELFKQSEKSYREGRLDEAVSFLNEAYKLDPKPVLLYNLARAYEALGDVPRAIEAYKSYLEHDPKTPDKGALEQRISSLERQQREKEELERRNKAQSLASPQPSSTPAPSAPRPQPTAHASPVPWVIAGVGLASIGAGITLGVLSKSKHDSAVSEPSAVTATNLQATAQQLATGANIAFIGGGILAAGGLVWGIFDVSRASKVQVGLGSVSVSGRF